MSEQEPVCVPTLEDIRLSLASYITQIVEYYQSGNHKTARIDEIVDGIKINNKAERETVYSAIDPYSEGTDKRDENMPLLFRKTSPAEYTFLGYSADPLELTSKMVFSDPIINEAYKIFSELAEKKHGKGALQEMTMSKRVDSFHRNMQNIPFILKDAQERVTNRKALQAVIRC
ncbi:hypothetical protein IMCC20628_04527 [Hoeflea sp. IMCC20628]|uniref:hypothetical protein n=1 Tax=Hoeflea sp. IMCC20628 TaxID=1620421 RepID=UPI00063AC606|nr:hypothetical protein [Hoeflea sp. IMCC20628]AKI03197.1 hypothetical protein IMCC20628_04527 [Hoeflea sp. IMCC20628]